jgi:hypothetical protein
VVRRLAVVLVLVSAAALASAAQGKQRLTLSFSARLVVARANETAPVGKPNSGFDFDDVLVNTRTQLGKSKGQPAGWDHGTLVYLSATTLEIVGVTTLPGYGTLTFDAVTNMRKDGSYDVPVIRGTGDFEGVSGTVIVGAGQKNTSPNTYVLTLLHPLVPLRSRKPVLSSPPTHRATVAEH